MESKEDSTKKVTMEIDFKNKDEFLNLLNQTKKETIEAINSLKQLDEYEDLISQSIKKVSQLSETIKKLNDFEIDISTNLI